MKSSTESLLNTAMDLNVRIQEDNLGLLMVKNELLAMAKDINNFTRIKNSINKNGIDAVTMKLYNALYQFDNAVGVNSNEVLKLTSVERKAYLSDRIDSYINDKKFTIAKTLVNMLEASIKDIDKVEKFKKVTTTPTSEKVVAYDRLACENLSKNLSDIIQKISFTSNLTLGYNKTREYLVNELGCDMSMVHTKISEEGYVTMDLPQPEVRSLSSGNWSDIAQINSVSDSLNNITYTEMHERLANMKLNMFNNIAKSNNIEENIRSTHLLAQLLMSAKNSIMLMKNYHKAFINSLTK